MPLPGIVRPSTLLGFLLAVTCALLLGLPSSGCCPPPRPVTVERPPEPRPPFPVRATPRRDEEWIRERAAAGIDGDPQAVLDLVTELKAERRDRDAHRRNGLWATPHE